MLNHLTYQGRLARDIEKKTTAGGIDNVSFTLCWSEKYKRQDGTEMETKCFLPCKAWRGTAGFLDKYFHDKGTEMLVEGRLETEEWEKDGEKHSRIVLNVDKVHFCGKRQDGNGQTGASVSGSAPADAKAADFTPVTDTDLPF